MADAYTYYPPASGALPPAILVREPDGAGIPCSLDNRDYQEFLAWMAEGNPAPAGWSGPTNATG